MRAVVHRSYGPAEVLEEAEVPEPVVGPRDVLVAVRAAAVNPVDVKMRAGSHRVVVPRRLPWVLGLDVSGVVVAVGDEVVTVGVGDEVFSSPGHHRWGTYAERVVIDEAEVARKPANVSHEEAASLPLVALTAWQCLVPYVRSGHRVFVQAGSGGVGTVAIQIAKHLGAWVATTCRAPNHGLVRSLGADRAIDYRSEDVGSVLSDVDVALESLVGPARLRTLAAMKRGGRVSFVSGGLPEWVDRAGPVLGSGLAGLDSATFVARSLLRGVTARLVVRRADGETLGAIAQWVEDGVVRPVVEAVYSMEDAAKAHRHVETGRTRGKVVLAGY